MFWYSVQSLPAAPAPRRPRAAYPLIQCNVDLLQFIRTPASAPPERQHQVRLAPGAPRAALRAWRRAAAIGMIASPAEASSQTASSTEFASAHRVRKADWADVRVGRRPIAVGAIAEGLGGRRQLHVRLDADCRLVIHLRTGSASGCREFCCRLCPQRVVYRKLHRNA